MQPVIIEDVISVAANTINNNVIASNTSLRRYLRAPFRGQGRLLFAQSAAGLFIDFDVGSKNIVSNSTAEVNSVITDPDNVIADQWGAEEGDQFVLRVANTTAGALSIRYRLELHPADELLPDVRVIQQGPISIANGAVDIQLLDGLRYERAPVDSIMAVFMTASASGLVRKLDVDTESIAPPSVVNPNNRVPRDPFDVTIQGVEAPEDKQLSLAVSNSSGGALNVFWRMKLYELTRS